MTRPRIKLSPDEGEIVAQVAISLSGAGYSDKSRHNARSNLRGLMKRGYSLLRTPEGRSARLQEPGSYAAKRAVQRSMGFVATVYGLETGLHLSRQGVVSVHQHLPDNALWPSAAVLTSGFDLVAAVKRLMARRVSAIQPHSGRPKEAVQLPSVSPQEALLVAAGLQLMQRILAHGEKHGEDSEVPIDFDFSRVHAFLTRNGKYAMPGSEQADDFIRTLIWPLLDHDEMTRKGER